MLLKKIHDLFRRKKNVEQNILNKSLKDYKQLSFWTAGVKFESRKDNVLKCKISETVELIREKNNINDSNAIHVKRIDGSSLGFVGRFLANDLAPYIDNGNIQSKATIVDLKCDMLNDIYGVKVALFINQNLSKKITKKTEEVEYLFEKSDSGNIYLLLECEESTLNEIIKTFENKSIEIIRSGISYRPGSNGKIYSWYLFIDPRVDKGVIDNILIQKYPYLKELNEKEIDTQYFELQDEEIGELKKSNLNLEDELYKLKKDLEKYKNNNLKFNKLFPKLIGITLSNVTFLRESMDILENEVLDFSVPLKKIIRLSSNDSSLKGKKVKTLNKWGDIHFNSGQRDDGRIYYRKNREKITVLVSFKKYQKRDILYLQRL